MPKIVSHNDKNGETLIQKVWLPVGSIYENKNDISDQIAKYFYGVWERYGNGEVLVGVDESDDDFKTSDKSLGEKTHKLTISEMPTHDHPINTVINGSNPGSGDYRIQTDRYQWGGTGVYSLGTSGGSQSHNNIQPSRTVYRWIRVS